ncbi:MAG TPA: TerB family tellurite resistance protein [Gemmataceae bacterium]|jgi:uncharacterized tellurite resistance protein B-like protein
MPTVIVCFALVVVLTAVISLAILHWQFRTWPPYVWKQSLLRRVDDLRRRRRELTGPDPDGAQARADRLAADLFDQHLRSVAVDRLAEFPGVGPNTVDRVRGAGGRTLADLPRFRFEAIHGIGPSKAHDLRTAVGQLVREARSRFDAGGCPEAQEFRRRLAALHDEVRDRAAAWERELTAVDAALRAAADPLAAAGEVTFWNYLFRRATTGPTAETMARPLPTGEPSAPPPARAAKPAPPPLPPPPPAPATRPVAAKSEAPVAFPPVTARPVSPPPADIFAAELRNATPAVAVSADAHLGLPKLWAYARFALVVAKADGRIAQAEKKVIRAFLDEQFGHDPVLVRHIDPLLERTEARVPPEAQAIAEVRSVTTAAERRELYRFAERVADASGERNRREQELLARVAAAFGLTMEAPPRPAAPVAAPETRPSPPTDPRAVLEIEPGIDLTADLIRRRYTLLTDKLDPAKAAGLGPEFAAMAAEKRSRLRAAAETLIAPFGEPLEKPALPPPADLRHNPDLDDVFQ